jgi:hypothetical protein
MGRPGFRAAASWLAVATTLSAFVVVDRNQPDACSSTGLPHADATLSTFVDADGTAQCAAKLDADDVAKLLGGTSAGMAQNKLTVDAESSAALFSVTVLGQFSDMTPGTFKAVARGIEAIDTTAVYRLYTLPRNDRVADAAIPALWSKLGGGSTAFLVRPDGSVSVMGGAIPSLTTKDPVQIAHAAIENAVGPGSDLAPENVLDGVDAAECRILQEEKFMRSIDLRGQSLSDKALSTLASCGKATIVVDTTVSTRYAPLEVRFVSNEPLTNARQCQQALPPQNDVSVAACTVALLADRSYSGLIS